MTTHSAVWTPMGSLKRKQVRVYLDEQTGQQFTRLVTVIGSMSESAVMTVLFSAALDACAENGYRMPLPLKFTINQPTATSPPHHASCLNERGSERGIKRHC